MQPLEAKGLIPTAIIDQLSALGSKATDAAETVGSGYRRAMGWTGLPELVGGSTSLLGRGIGAALAALMSPAANYIEGKPTFQDIGRDVKNISESTARFGQKIGEEGTYTAPLTGMGKLMSGFMAFPPARRAMRDVGSGKVGLQTGIDLGSAAALAAQAIRSPYWTPGGILEGQLGSFEGGTQEVGAKPWSQDPHGFWDYKDHESWMGAPRRPRVGR